MQNSLKRWGSCAGLLVFITVISGVLLLSHQFGWSDNQVNEKKLTELRHKKQSDYWVVFRKTGCPDCAKVQLLVSEQLLKNQMKSNQRKTKVVVIDVKPYEAHHYINEFGLTQVPTFIQVKGGREVYRYEGTNPADIKQMFAN
ncbi:hypothetical protein JK159_02295 [Weissella minor]|uniref:thioredoxin domain-containing protein n=1 Tax=Weissella minor TaxID=1620 RepID=UPI001BAF499C|nr:thioredoxin domain-containing protein [Weissella minor]MBS0949213.1 hypothetical protein [Weissella minor]